MKRRQSIICLFLATFLFASCQSYEQKKQLTLKKQTDVNLLIKSLAQKLQTLNDASSKLLTATNQCSLALKEMKPTDVKVAMSYPKAKRHLLVLQKALAYKEIVNGEYGRTYSAYQELLGVSEQLELDMIMLNSFDEANFDKLLEELEDVLDNVQPMAQELVIGEENLKLPDLNLIWKEYVTK
ncbi:MAG: hypothetical protein AAB575_02995 [Patescibacteria group bacterium]